MLQHTNFKLAPTQKDDSLMYHFAGVSWTSFSVFCFRCLKQ